MLFPIAGIACAPPVSLGRILLRRRGPGPAYNPEVDAIEAVVFDIGGVVMESPLHAIARYERDHGLAANAINRVVVASGEHAPGPAWNGGAHAGRLRRRSSRPTVEGTASRWTPRA